MEFLIIILSLVVCLFFLFRSSPKCFKTTDTTMSAGTGSRGNTESGFAFAEEECFNPNNPYAFIECSKWTSDPKCGECGYFRCSSHPQNKEYLEEVERDEWLDQYAAEQEVRILKGEGP